MCLICGISNAKVLVNRADTIRGIERSGIDFAQTLSF